MTERFEDQTTSQVDSVRKSGSRIDMIAALAEMEAYWNELRGDRRLPQRRNVDPGRIGQALSSAFLIQRVAPSVARIRVAGERLSGLLGMEARGMPLTAFFSAEARVVVIDHITRLFDEPAIIELPIMSRRGLGRPKLAGRMLILPLIGDDGLVSAALGAIIVDGTIGTAPRRFDIAPGRIRCQEVHSTRIGDLHQQILARSGALRDPAVASLDQTAAMTSSERPYLRLVVDNA